MKPYFLMLDNSTICLPEEGPWFDVMAHLNLMGKWAAETMPEWQLPNLASFNPGSETLTQGLSNLMTAGAESLPEAVTPMVLGGLTLVGSLYALHRMRNRSSAESAEPSQSNESKKAFR